MATRPANFFRSNLGVRRARGEVKGFKELQLKLKELSTALGQEDKARQSLLAREQHRILLDGAKQIADEARRRGQGRVPRRVVASIFTFANPAKDKPKRSAALVGVNKQRTMVEWKARSGASFNVWGGHSYGKNVKRKASAGKKIAMSLATMFEHGTTRMNAYPFFGPAVRAIRARVMSSVTSGLKSLIEKFGRAA